MSTSDTGGGRVRAPRPHPITTTEKLLARLLDEMEKVVDLLDEHLPRRVQEPAPPPGPQNALPAPVRVAEPAPVTVPKPGLPRSRRNR